MIVSHIIGGLGNQLFQYAAGRYLAEKHQVPLLLDITDFTGYHLRNFELHNLHTRFSIAQPEDFNRLKPTGKLAKALQYLKPKPARTYHREHHFHVEPSFFKIGPNAYIKGNFQSFRYFEPIAGIIRKEFEVKEELIRNVKELGDTIQNQPSVAVHIRRGDYTKKVFLEYHGLLSEAYYNKAIDLLLKKESGLKFYFFSDDLPWVKQHISAPNAIYVSGEHSTGHYEDFYLMSRCRHNIIANSSFSWWAAWMNNNPGKMVIAPKQWFNKAGHNTKDLVPENWLRV